MSSRRTSSPTWILCTGTMKDTRRRCAWRHSAPMQQRMRPGALCRAAMEWRICAGAVCRAPTQRKKRAGTARWQNKRCAQVLPADSPDDANRRCAPTAAWKCGLEPCTEHQRDEGRARALCGSTASDVHWQCAPAQQMMVADSERLHNKRCVMAMRRTLCTGAIDAQWHWCILHGPGLRDCTGAKIFSMLFNFR